MLESANEPNIRIITEKISLVELKNIASERFGDMIKAVVDIERKLMAIGGGMHADEEEILLEQGSSQENLWGINVYPDKSGAEFIEFDSMINLRPRQNNRSRSVENVETQERIRAVVQKLIS